MQGLFYQVSIPDPARRQFRIALTINRFSPEAPIELELPAWTPGSYLIREYAGSVVTLEAVQDGRKLEVRKTRKDCFSFVPGKKSPVCVTYTVNAVDSSVRRLWISREYAFITGAAAFLRPAGLKKCRCRVAFDLPEEFDFIATAMKRISAPEDKKAVFEAKDYDELIDCPVMAGPSGSIAKAEFTAGGVPHRLSVFGCPRADTERLAADLKKICETEIRFWSKGGIPPFPSYDFLISTAGGGWGGLEHCGSVAAAAPVAAFPFSGAEPPDKYTELLALLAHEYFHAWNVKRLKPAAFLPYDLQNETYTTLLWFFEGFTEYYEEIILFRAGLISEKKLLERISSFFMTVYSREGHRYQSLAESSYDTWIKLYRPDDASANTGISYYTKGALAAFALDLMIRNRSDGARSLDSAMRELWTTCVKKGLSEDSRELIAAVSSAAGIPKKEAAGWVRTLFETAEPIGWKELLATEGLRLASSKRDFWRDALGARLSGDAEKCVIASLSDTGCLARAGLLPGDELVALDGFRLRKSSAEGLARQIGSCAAVLSFFRKDRLLEAEIELRPNAAPPKLSLQFASSARKSWPKAA